VFSCPVMYRWRMRHDGQQRWSRTSRVLGGRMIERSGDAMCDPHHTRGGDKKRRFPGLAAKLVATVWWFRPQNHLNCFLVWASKLRSMVWWFGSQNYCDSFLICTSKPSGRSLSVCASKPMSGWRWCEDTSTSSSLLHHEASQARVSQFCLKTGEGVTTGGGCGIITHVTWKWTEDGRLDGVRCGAVEIRPNYPSLVVIFLLPHRVILVFSLLL
jgi:hypothetical protein